MKIVISDCDHGNIAMEEKVFRDAGYSIELQKNKTAEDVIANCSDVDVIINQYAPFTEEVFASLPNLKQIVRYGVGVNNIDVEAATKYGVQICNVPDYGTNEVADHALALTMALTRKVAIMSERVKRGIWDYQSSIPIYRFSEQTVGIIGVGRIGTAYAKRVAALGSRIIAWDPSAAKKKDDPSFDFIEFLEFDEVLSQADIISIHCPLESAVNLFNQKTLRTMKKGAYLINVSRGGIVDEQALCEVLIDEHLAGAALDVLKVEPIMKTHTLMSLEQVLLTPHMAWYSEESGQELKRKVAEEAIRFIHQEQLHYPVNKL